MTAPGWPRGYHPLQLLEVDTPQGGTVWTPVVDTSTTVQGWQLRPDTWVELAAWCGGVKIVGDDGAQEIAVGSLDEEHRARLGDFVMSHSGGMVVDRADGHVHRWVEAGAEQPAAPEMPGEPFEEPGPVRPDQPAADTSPGPAPQGQRTAHEEP